MLRYLLYTSLLALGLMSCSGNTNSTMSDEDIHDRLQGTWKGGNYLQYPPYKNWVYHITFYQDSFKLKMMEKNCHTPWYCSIAQQPIIVYQYVKGTFMVSQGNVNLDGVHCDSNYVYPFTSPCIYEIDTGKYINNCSCAFDVELAHGWTREMNMPCLMPAGKTPGGFSRVN